MKKTNHAYPFTTFAQRTPTSGRYYRGLKTSELRGHLRGNAAYLNGELPAESSPSLVAVLLNMRAEAARESFRLAKELRRREMAGYAQPEPVSDWTDKRQEA